MPDRETMPRVRRRRRGSLLRRARRSGHLGLLAKATLVVVLVAVAWCGWLAWQVKQDLDEVAQRAQALRSLLVEGDAERSRQELASYQEAAQSASSRTSGITWSLLESMPLLGDDASGVTVMARTLTDLGEDGLGPLVDVARSMTADTFRPRNGTFPVQRIADLQEPTRQSETAFAAALADLSAVDSSTFFGRVQREFDELTRLVTTAHESIDVTSRAARLLPLLMGESRPRTYLLVLQNNAELRSGGGLPGALSLVRMHEGRISIREQIDTAKLGTSVDPVVRLTPEERRVFGSILGRVSVDATLTPDFPRAAEILKARWELVKGGRIDGVFAIDPVAVSYLLQGSDPVPVPGYPPIGSPNVVAAVENQIYQQSDDPAVHSAYQQAVAKAVFDVFANGRVNTPQLLRGLFSGVGEGRIRMHSFDPAEQSEIAGTEIAGEFSAMPGPEPKVGVYINDGGPTKMQFYLRYGASLASRSCSGGRQELGGSVEFHSDTPANVRSLPPAITAEGFPGQRVKPGDQLLVVYLTSPVGGQISELRMGGKVISPVLEPFSGRSLARIGVLLRPQERLRIEFTMQSGDHQQGDPQMWVTPGAFPGSANRSVPSSCAVR